jgi:hypothetical protein
MDPSRIGANIKWIRAMKSFFCHPGTCFYFLLNQAYSQVQWISYIIPQGRTSLIYSMIKYYKDLKAFLEIPH